MSRVIIKLLMSAGSTHLLLLVLKQLHLFKSEKMSLENINKEVDRKKYHLSNNSS